MRWRQFHLSTAVLLMLTAGLLLWLNFRPNFGWHWTIVTAKQIKPPPEVELVDFRLGGTYSIQYGWPWPARRWLWEVEPMLVVHPAEIPPAWPQQALRQKEFDLTFVISTQEEFDRVLPGERLRPIQQDGRERFVYTGAGFETEPAWSLGGVFANALAAAGLLLGIGVCFEWRLQRKARCPAVAPR